MWIGSNKYQLYGKVVILVFGLFVLYGLFQVGFDDGPIVESIFLGFVSTMFLLMFILMTLQLFILPTSVEIDHDDKTLTLCYLVSRSKIFHVDDFIDYSSILVSTRSSSYDGIMIQNTDGKEYILGDFNLDNYEPIKKFLDESEVKFAGHKKFSFMSYFYRYFTI